MTKFYPAVRKNSKCCVGPCIMYYINYKSFVLQVSFQNILNVSSNQKRETREIIKFVLNLTYLYYTN
jgi:hypothetical protein